MSSTNLSQKYKLSNQERDYYESLADLYSIMIATEQIERAYLKSTISANDYTQICQTLIGQFKTFTGLMPDINIKNFMAQYEMNCPAAYKRLVEIGVPATVEHSVQVAGTASQNKIIAETVQFFITLMDSLKLNVIAVDEVHPQLSDLMQTLNKAHGSNWGKSKIKDWLIALNQMKASDELDPTQVRQLLFDLESAYAEFQHSLTN